MEVLLCVLLAGLFEGFEACNNQSISQISSIYIIILGPCALTTNVVDSTQLLLRHIESNMGPQLLSYRGNLTVTDCTRKKPSANFLCTTEMVNMTIWNVSDLPFVYWLALQMPRLMRPYKHKCLPHFLVFRIKSIAGPLWRNSNSPS